jgi:hypothetical protein
MDLAAPPEDRGRTISWHRHVPTEGRHSLPCVCHQIWHPPGKNLTACQDSHKELCSKEYHLIFNEQGCQSKFWSSSIFTRKTSFSLTHRSATCSPEQQMLLGSKYFPRSKCVYFQKFCTLFGNDFSGKSMHQSPTKMGNPITRKNAEYQQKTCQNAGLFHHGL